MNKDYYNGRYVKTFNSFRVFESTNTAYSKVEEQIKSIEGCEVIGEVDGVNLYRIKRGQGKKVLLSGAVHGDEPAGTFALIEFMNNHMQQYESSYEFTIFPCVNPHGFNKDYRGNDSDLNLNREFKKETQSKEVKIILPLLEQYVFCMDLHETMSDWVRIGDNEPTGEDPNEFYLWETCPNKSSRVGDKIIKNVESAGIPVCKWETIYGDKNNGGVIWYPENCGTPSYANEGPFDTYLSANHTKHAFTIETFKHWAMNKRVLANIISIKTALDNI